MFVPGRPIAGDDHIKGICHYGDSKCGLEEGGVVTWTVNPAWINDTWATVYKGQATLQGSSLIVESLQSTFTVTSAQGEWQTTQEGFRFKQIQRVNRVVDESFKDILNQTRPDMLTKLEYMTSSLEMLLRSTEELCKEMRSWSEMLGSQSEIDEHYRAKLASPYITVRVTDHYVVVWPCVAVDTWIFDENVTECHDQIPVLIQERMWGRHYLDPKTGDMYSSSVPVECPDQPVWLEVGGVLYTYFRGKATRKDTSAADILPGGVAAPVTLPKWRNVWTTDESVYSRETPQSIPHLRRLEKSQDVEQSGTWYQALDIKSLVSRQGTQAVWLINLLAHVGGLMALVHFGSAIWAKVKQQNRTDVNLWIYLCGISERKTIRRDHPIKKNQQ